MIRDTQDDLYTCSCRIGYKNWSCLAALEVSLDISDEFKSSPAVILVILISLSNSASNHLLGIHLIPQRKQRRDFVW